MRGLSASSSVARRLLLEVRTDQPAVQLYTGNPVGFCLETQNYRETDRSLIAIAAEIRGRGAINAYENFPSPILRPGTPFRSTTVFAFLALSRLLRPDPTRPPSFRGKTSEATSRPA